MSYTIKELNEPKAYFAVLEMTISDHSRALHKQAVSSITSELKRLGVEVSDEPYNYIVSFENEDRIEVVDLEVFVRVKTKGKDTEAIQFREVEETGPMIRVLAETFPDVHTGLAEWMHDNDFMADGPLRQVVSDEAEYVFDCQIKVSED